MDSTIRGFGRRLLLLGVVVAAAACAASDSGRDLVGPEPVPQASLLSLGRGPHLVLAPLRLFTISDREVIDEDGGRLHAVDLLTGSTYDLVVPPGAVSGPTIFTLVVPAGRFYEADLTAEVRQADGSLVDVGKRGFARPVTLSIRYLSPLELLIPSRLFIAWIDDDGDILQGLSTKRSLLTSTVQADLAHFSKYALASN